jgi:hypothetical protein
MLLHQMDSREFPGDKLKEQVVRIHATRRLKEDMTKYLGFKSWLALQEQFPVVKNQANYEKFLFSSSTFI